MATSTIFRAGASSLPLSGGSQGVFWGVSSALDWQQLQAQRQLQKHQSESSTATTRSSRHQRLRKQNRGHAAKFAATKAGAGAATTNGSDYDSEEGPQVEGVKRVLRRRQHPRTAAAASSSASSSSSLGFRHRSFVLRLLSSGSRGGSRGWFGRTVGAVSAMVLLGAADQPGQGAPLNAAAAAAMAAASLEGQQHGKADTSKKEFNIPSFLPSLGPLEPAAPAINFAIAGLVGYGVGHSARVLTRVVVLLAGVGGLALYGLARQGLIELRWDRIRKQANEAIEEGQEQVEGLVGGQRKEIAKKLQNIIDTLTQTVAGVGFSIGFLIAFK